MAGGGGGGGWGELGAKGRGRYFGAKAGGARAALDLGLERRFPMFEQLLGKRTSFKLMV